MDQDNHQQDNLQNVTTDELRDEQLDKVTGGLVVISIIGILIGQLLPPAPTVKKA